MPVTVHSLPAELLCRIFIHSSSIDPCTCVLAKSASTRGYAEGRKRELGWFASTTHTCRRWRQIALGCAELWASNICTFHSSTATECFLERAGQFSALAFEYSPLSWRRELSEDQVVLATEHIERVKAFSQSHNGPMFEEFVGALCAAPRPNLTVLMLNRWEDMPDGLVVNGLSLDAPALEVLYLDGLLLSTSAPNLREFTFANSEEYDCSASIQLLMLSILKTTPLLEELVVRHMVSGFVVDQNDMDAITAEPVRLPHLRRLIVRMSGDCPAFLKPIQPALDAKIEIHDDYLTPSSLFEPIAGCMLNPAYDTLLVYEEPRPDSDPSRRPQIFSGFYVNIHLCSSTAPQQDTFTFKIRALMPHVEDSFSWLELMQMTQIHNPGSQC